MARKTGKTSAERKQPEALNTEELNQVRGGADGTSARRTSTRTATTSSVGSASNVWLEVYTCPDDDVN